jgi:hypothetical protein
VRGHRRRTSNLADDINATAQVDFVMRDGAVHQAATSRQADES